MIEKIIPIHFEEFQETQYNSESLSQWDCNIQLAISGLDISEEMIEVHFSLEERDGTAKRILGVVESGIIHVNLPAFILEGPEHTCGNTYKAWAWVYLLDEETAKTVRKIEFDIKTRAKPDEYVTPEELSFLEQLEVAIKKKLDSSGHAPNKFLGTDENGNVVTKEVEKFSLEVASETKLGGVKPVTKTDAMTQPVGVDKEGKLYTAESGINEETFLKLAIKPTTDKSTFHQITDSAEYRVIEFGMEGKTEQKTVPGNQLFDMSKVADYNGDSYGYVDATLTNNGDGSLTVNTITAQSVGLQKLSELAPNLVVGETYTLNAITTGEAKYIIVGETWVFGTSKTITEDMLNSSVRWYANGPGTTATISDIMLNPGTTVLPFEEYVGDTASPNPDYPQEIVNAGVLNEESGRYEHKCCVGNKNLFDVKSFAEATGQTINDDGSIALRSNAKRYYFDLPDIPVSFTWDFISTDSTGVAILKFVMKDGSVQYIADSNSTIKIKKQLDYVTVLAWQPVTVKNLRMMYDSSTTDYTPHASQPFTLTSPVPLTKWDYKAKRDGIHGWSINSINPVLNGTEHWVYFEAYNAFYIRLGTNIKYTVDAKCSHYLYYGTIVDDKNNIFKVLGGAFDDMVWIRDTRFNNVEDFKAWLSENNVMLSIPTVEEQAFIPLPDEEQTLLNSLETYYEVTNIYNDQGCPMWIKYVADSKLYIDNQILEIKQSIV